MKRIFQRKERREETYNINKGKHVFLNTEQTSTTEGLSRLRLATPKEPGYKD